MLWGQSRQASRELMGSILWNVGGASALSLCVFSSACGGKAPQAENAEPASSSGAAEASPASSSGSTPETGPGAAQAEAESPTEGAPAPPAKGADPAKLVLEICERTCDRVEKQCDAKQTKFCRASCRDYASGAEHCPVEIHGALACQENAEDFQLCANISDEACVPLFRKMVECRTGKAKPRVWGDTSLDAKTDFAAGLKPLTVSGYGMTQLMPEGTSVKGGDAYRALKTDGSARWVIEATSLEGSTLSNTTILRTVTKYVGNACQPKLRLHGRFESGGVLHTRFDTVCKDGTEYHGVAHFWPARVLMVAHIGPGSTALEEGRRDAFLFGFKMTE